MFPSFVLFFPSLNNRPRLSSNTADRHWELAARERERMGGREGEREREVDWRLVLRLLFLRCRYCPVTEKKNIILKINRMIYVL